MGRAKEIRRPLIFGVAVGLGWIDAHATDRILDQIGRVISVGALMRQAVVGVKSMIVLNRHWERSVILVDAHATRSLNESLIIGRSSQEL
jgi:hypothetical protein